MTNSNHFQLRIFSWLLLVCGVIWIVIGITGWIDGRIISGGKFAWMSGPQAFVVGIIHIMAACYGFKILKDKIQNRDSEPSHPLKPTLPGTSSAEQPRVPGSGAE